MLHWQQVSSPFLMPAACATGGSILRTSPDNKLPSVKTPEDPIEAALGDDAASVLPEAIRLVELRARVPRYQREMLRKLARREGTSVDHVLTRELEDVASAHAEELAGVPGFAMAKQWPAG